MSAKSRRMTQPRKWWIGLVAAIVLPTLLSLPYRGKTLSAVLGASQAGARSAGTAPWQPSAQERKSTDVHARTYATLPLAFEPNQGQADSRIKYMARGPGYSLFLTANETVFLRHTPMPDCAPLRRQLKMPGCVGNPLMNPRLPSVTALRMGLAGAQPPQIIPEERLPGITNYFVGKNPHQWRTGVRQYGRVRMAGVYPGIDLDYHGLDQGPDYQDEAQQFEFDFRLAPEADPQRIRLYFSGADEVAVDDAGNLVVSSLAGNLRLHRAFAYQVRDGVREAVEANYTRKPGGLIGFALGSYDHDRELIIDPVLSYSTYLGGTGEDEAASIAVDSAGTTYVTGTTQSPDFPAGSGTLSAGGGFDVFVSKLNAVGSAVVYTTLIGGEANEFGDAIAVDAKGNAYVAGITTSNNFPTTSGVLQSALDGPQDGFVVKLNPNGLIVYSTYLGGSASDSPLGLALDASGNAYVGGETLSSDFPGTSASTIQSSNVDGHAGFVAKLNSTGSTLAFATYLGGSNADLVTSLALDASGNVYAAGITLSPDFPTTAGALKTKCGSDGNCDSGFDDGFITKIKADGSAIMYSTFLGGSRTDDVLGIDVNKSSGEAYVAGATNSADFPKANAAQNSLGGAEDAFVAKLNANGTGLLFSTNLGGNADDAATGIALDAFHDVYVTGRTLSANFPIASAFQASNGGMPGSSDAFVTELNFAGGLVYSSYLGGAGNENSFSGQVALGALGAVAVDAASNAYLAGSTASTTDFPTTQSALATSYSGGLADAFVAKVAAAPADFLISATPPSTSLSAGGSAAYSVTLSPVNSSFGNAVALSCSGLPRFAACSFADSSMVPGSSSVTTALTVSTGLAIARRAAPGNKPHYYAAWFPLAGMGLVGLAFACRSRARPKSTLALVGLSLIFIAGCVVRNPPQAGGGSGNTVTPGSYNFTIMGTSGPTTHSASVTMVVH